ncbi:hypothetical protein [Maricaulis sp.]|uniref:hypothetical protein n=1 Tax=Maricaulis sp. TaxID=1486257 RepID=UPI003A91491C
MMGFFGKLFVMASAALGLFVSGLDLLERFDVDVNGWLRGIPPVMATLPETYGDWIDRFASERLAESDRAMPQATPRLEASDDVSSEAPAAMAPRSMAVEGSSTATLISAGFAVVMALILGLVSRGLFRRD